MKLMTLDSFTKTIVASTIFFLAACGTSTSSRYSQKEENTMTDSLEINQKILSKQNEDFDITPYKTEIVIPEKKIFYESNDTNVWFDYGSPEIENKPKSLVGTQDGFRVLVLTTDNIEEANLLKTDEYFSKSPDEVYVDFEPPFYKLKVGDFSAQKSADDLKFKLNQLGYKDAKVIKDKINIFK